MNKRPVNLDLTTIRLPLSAILSILHRISGVIIFLGMPILLWMFGQSLSSEADFLDLQKMLDNTFYKLVFLGILAALSYHIIAGIKHLFMDKGIGESEAGAKIAARLVVFFTVIAFIFLGSQL
ncbi:MAG: succinate dehydrogenase / fumarate reductase cytochrome b subunit [Enterobacterales bacterium]